MQKLKSFTDWDNLYFLTASVVLGLVIAISLLEYRAGDFWVYSSIAYYLSEAPFRPGNPISDASTLNTTYWPYLVLVGCIANVSSLEPYQVLSLLAPCNALFLLWSFRKFVVSLTAETKAPALSLLFVLLYWGREAYFHGGFLHLLGLTFTAANPSTLGLAIVFFLGSRWRRLDSAQSPLSDVVAAVSFISLIIVHQLSWLLAAVLLVSLCVLQSYNSLYRRSFEAAALIVCSLGLAWFWPMFPLARIVFAEGGDSATGALIFYDAHLQCMIPTFIFVLITFFRFRKNKCDSLALSVSFLLGIYLLSVLSDSWSYGRVLAFINILSCICAADFFIRNYRQSTYVVQKGYLGLLWLSMLWFGTIRGIELSDALRYYKPDVQGGYKELEEVTIGIPKQRTILAPKAYGVVLNGLGYKVVINDRNSLFLEDFTAREKFVERFYAFEPVGPDQERFPGTYSFDFLVCDVMCQRQKELYQFIESNYSLFSSSKVFKIFERT